METMELNPFWQDRPVFVTGATGLLGSWLVTELLKHQADVVCLLRDHVPQADLLRTGNLNRVRAVYGDIRDQELMERALGEYEIDTVFHLAAQTTVQVASRNPISTLDSNIRGTWTVLEAARRSPAVKQIVLASSDKAYGDQSELPYTENAPLIGRYPYDVSKSCADLLAQSYAKTYELPVAITRCGNFYGGGDLNWNRIIPGTIRSVLRGDSPIVRSDGLFVRDYFYIEDGARAYMTLAEKLAENRSLIGEAFNFSTETPMTVLQVVDAVLQAMDSNLQAVVQNQASHEIKEQYLSAKKAHELLGWSSDFSMKEGLMQTIAWYRRYFEEQS